MIDYIKNKFLYGGVAIGSLIFIISSGGSTLLRLLGLALMLGSFCIHVFKNRIFISKSILVACGCFCLALAIGVVRSTVEGNEHTAIYYLAVFLVFLFPLLLAMFSSYNTEYLNRLIKFISWSYIVLFFIVFILLFLLRQQFGATLLLFVKGNEYFEGLYYRPAFIFEYYPAIWFQYSILAMPFALWNLYKNNMQLFFLLALIVFLSLNRTGSIIVIAFYIIRLFKHEMTVSKVFLYFVFLLPFFFFALCAILNLAYSTEFVNDGSGLGIRLGHILSVFDNLYKVENFLFGMGADSSFLTLGRTDAGLVWDQEISYLEILRRFGIIGYLLFSCGFFISLLHFYNSKDWPAFYSFLGYILFSFTNPSLISMTFAIFFAIISSSGRKSNLRKTNVGAPSFTS